MKAHHKLVRIFLTVTRPSSSALMASIKSFRSKERYLQIRVRYHFLHPWQYQRPQRKRSSIVDSVSDHCNVFTLFLQGCNEFSLSSGRTLATTSSIPHSFAICSAASIRSPVSIMTSRLFCFACLSALFVVERRASETSIHPNNAWPFGDKRNGYSFRCCSLNILNMR